MRFTREFWVGFLGILSLVIVYFLINFFKGISIIDKGNAYYVKFDNIGEIVNSSPIFINGYKVGNVQEIQYDFATREGAFVKLAIDSRLQIPVGSIAEVNLELLGSSSISIIASNSKSYLQPGDTLKGRFNGGAMDEASKMIPVLNEMLPKVDSILVSLNGILANPAINKTLENTEQLSAQLGSTAAEIEKLLKK